MKKWIAGILAVVLMVGAAGCSTGQEESDKSEEAEEKLFERFNDINEFIEKYKREDFDEMLENPEMFLMELNTLWEANETDYSTWEIDEELSSVSDWATWYKKDVVLFNWPVEASVTVMDLGEYTSASVSFSFEMASPEQERKAAQALCEYLFAKYDDATSIQVGDEDTTEKALRDCFNEGKEDVSFSCRWSADTEGKENDDDDFWLNEYYAFYINYYYFGLQSWTHTSLIIGN